MTNIRRYTASDFEMLQSWAKGYGVETFTREMLPHTTYIASYEDRPMISLSLIATNADRAYLEYALGDPALMGPLRRQLFRDLVQYVETEARRLGFQKVICLAPNSKLGSYYSSFGYVPNLLGLSLMVKELN